MMSERFGMDPDPLTPFERRFLAWVVIGLLFFAAMGDAYVQIRKVVHPGGNGTEYVAP